MVSQSVRNFHPINYFKVYNELVCNCHEDSKLLDVISLVEKVYQANTQRERVKYGRRLQKSIKGFMEEFLEHMVSSILKIYFFIVKSMRHFFRVQKIKG